MGCNVQTDSTGEAVVMACGEHSEPLCRCGHFSELLCDYPVGEGRTCDLALCPCCSSQVGDDYHLCLIHRAMFDEAAAVGRVNVWPPR